MRMHMLTMPLTEYIKRAANFWSVDSDDSEDSAEYLDNEILFSKNNVCVHPPRLSRHELDVLHHPGYLTVTTKIFTDQHNNAKRSTLFLNWIPNTTLRRCPSAIKNNEDITKIRSPEEEKNIYGNPFLTKDDLKKDEANGAFSDTSDSVSTTSSSDKHSLKSNDSKFIGEMTQSLFSDADKHEQFLDEEAKDIFVFDKYVRSQSMTSVNITIANPNVENMDVTPDGSLAGDKFMRSLSMSSCDEANPNWSTPEFLALKHNLVFPDSANGSPMPQRRAALKCRRFSVDLSQMRSLRLFFNDESCTCGQLVVASRESQYKILHFHHGSLDRLARVLHRWHTLLHNVKLTSVGTDEPNLPYRHFMVCRPEVQRSEEHPEEGRIAKLTSVLFTNKYLNSRGQIDDDLSLRKCVFFSGLDRDLRSQVWPFLLHCYPYNSTYEEREAILELRKQEYGEINKRRMKKMTPDEHENFWRTVQCVIEKDVVRTDRANPFFAGENNENIEIMKNILLNYAVYNPNLGYTQGMSDLLAPVLCEIREEAQTFWCFVGLMQRAFFVCTPTDNDMDKNLNYLRELIRIMVPNFYQHLLKHKDAMELLFCHRWILLCLKREFTEPVALRMWEACWSNFLTDYFHIFLCLAIVAIYADDVIAQDLKTDEMLLHFSSLALYMDGQVILRKARGLLHQFRQLPRVPCTLALLCLRCGPGMWDSEHRPALECVGHVRGAPCHYAGQ